jgi:hypothetical protein
MIEAITARFGPIDVPEYAPTGLDLLNVAAAVRDADAASFELPRDLLLRTPVTTRPPGAPKSDGHLRDRASAASGGP